MVGPNPNPPSPIFHRACCIYYNNAPASPRAPPRRAYYPGSAGVRARRWALAGVQLARASLPLVEAESENRVEVQLPSSALAQSASAVAAQAKTKTPVLTSGWAVKEPLFLLSTLLYIHKVCAVFWRVFFKWQQPDLRVNSATYLFELYK